MEISNYSDSRSKPNARGQPYRPGDLILDRYMPNASDWEREEARENLKQFAAVILRILTRLATEDMERAKNDRSSPGGLNGEELG